MTAALRGSLRWALLAAVVTAALYWCFEFLEAPANQLFGKTVVSGPANQRVVALTYDDGPNAPYTERILDVLEREHVRATFFVVGRAVVADPRALKRMMRDGDAIGNHSWDHSHLLVLDAAHVRRSLDQTDAVIYSSTGIHTRIMRPPFGQRDWMVMDQVRKLGYTPVMWSVPLADDWDGPPASVIARRIVPNVRDGSIVVLHDGNRGIPCNRDHIASRVCDRSSDVDATRLIVEALKKEGYRFVTVPEMLQDGHTMHMSAHARE